MTELAGSVHASVVAIAVVTTSLIVGIVAGFPPWWQTFVYAAGALVTVLMLFVIQHSTNQQTGAILLKLDELIHTSESARNEAISAEEHDVRTQDRLRDQLAHRDADERSAEIP